MTPRMFAAVLASFLGTTALLVPVETGARPGGMIGGPAMPSMGFRPPLPRPPVVRAPIVRPPVAPPIARPGLQAPLPAAPRTAIAPWHPGRPWQRPPHRTLQGFVWPAAGLWPAATYYDPSDSSVLYRAPPDPYPASTLQPMPYPVAPTAAERLTRAIVQRPGCQAQTETVPWHDGTDHSITMVRC